MIKTLTAVGNSLGLIIDKPILELLNIDKDTQLEVRTDGEGLIIRPVRPETARPEVAPAFPVAEPPAPAPLAEDLELEEVVVPAAPEAPPPPPAPPAPPQAEASPPPGPASAPPAPPSEAESAGSKPKRPDPAERPPVGAPEVVIELRGEEKARVPLKDEAVVIGRDPGCDLHLDDRALSRKHAKVERRGAAIWVIDLDSANGTYVNGERITEPHRMHGGDVVGVGHYRVRIDGVSEAKSDTPVLTLRGPEGTHRFAMVGEQIIIGRSQSCDISIGHKSISRRHVRIAAAEGGFVVEDLGSQNPAKLNGKALKEPLPFKAGDRLEICDFSLELGYLEESKKVAGKDRPRTMLIDHSVMAQAAYVDGDFENVRPGQDRPGTGTARKADTGEYKVEGEEAKKRSDGRIVRPKKKR